MNGIVEIAQPSLDRLYQLLPVIHRQRDEALGWPLRDLLQVIAKQVNIVEEDIRQLYENWFIETCQDWVVPYIGDLIGYQHVHEAGEPGSANTPGARLRNKILIPRREVARTILSRRRRGTLPLLEELARDTAGWPARAVEFYRLLTFTQPLNQLELARGRLVDLRRVDALDLIDGPFDKLGHTADVRSVRSHRTQGRYNLPNVGLFVFRLKAYPVTKGQCACLEDEGMPNAYTFSFLGADAPLYAKTQPETDPHHIADETNLPVPIRRLAFEREKARFYGEGKSLQLYEGVVEEAVDKPKRNAADKDAAGRNGNHQKVRLDPINADRIVPADLSDWGRYRPPEGKVAVDPALGRILFHPAASPAGVWASYYYGFSANMGGDEYNRTVHQPSVAGLFDALDLKNLVSLAKLLRTPSSPLNKYLSERFQEKTRELLEQYDGSDSIPEELRKKLTDAFVEELNLQLQNERLYDERRFIGVNLNQETQRLLALMNTSGLTRDELSRLNRLLLEQAFPNELGQYFRIWRVGEGETLKTLDAALQKWREAKPRNAIIEITDNGVYSEPLSITLELGRSLQIRAANKKRPVIFLRDVSKNRPEWLGINSESGGCMILDGLLITGRSVRVTGKVEQVKIRHCTFVPGWGVSGDCEPRRPAKPSLELYKTNCRVIVERSIIGSIQVYKDEVRSDPVEIRISDSIVDATSDEREAVGAPNWPRAHATLHVARSAVIGQVQTHAIAHAEDSIFTGLITVTRRQFGCMRFCYVPPGSRTPNRFQCQPDLVEQIVNEKFPPSDIRERVKAAERLRVQPQFNSVRYGKPAYCQLADSCANEIKRGASDESEMGAFHDLFQPQREANLRARLD
ncbi:MAG: hypothetical protein ACRD9Y_06465, partial [Blastocatellia bacterium]